MSISLHDPRPAPLTRRRILFGVLLTLLILALAVTHDSSQGVGDIPERISYTQELPPCPEVYYDGILPSEGGTGPIWSTPDGLPPTYDCNGPGHVDLPPSPAEDPTEVPTPADLPPAEVMEVAQVIEVPAPTPPALIPAPTCTEDMDCWDCATMGNLICGPTMSDLMEEWMQANPLPAL